MKNLEARRRDSRLNLMYNITHNITAVSAEELGMVAADGRTKANHHFKFRAMGAVTAQLHGSFVARTIPEWNRLPAAAADAVSPTSFQSKLNTLPAVWSRRRRLSILCAIRRWPSFDSRQKAVLQSNNKTRQDKTRRVDTSISCL